MGRLLTAFAGKKTREYLTGIFESAEISPAASCGTGAEILALCRAGDVVICGYRLLDMFAEELYAQLPPGCRMILLAEPAQLEPRFGADVVCVAAPAGRQELVDAVRASMDAPADAPLPKRTATERLVVEQAKALLMSRDGMSEEQAHRYIQKRSMDSGRKMADTAAEVLEEGRG